VDGTGDDMVDAGIEFCTADCEKTFAKGAGDGTFAAGNDDALDLNGVVVAVDGTAG
jgi:hypothetical protein